MAKTTRLNLKSRAEFAVLSLHEKNEYIQGIAQHVAHVRGDPYKPLDKDALSRIRRYYSRRSLADLRLEQLPDDDLKSSLARLAEAIRSDEVARVISHEVPTEPKPIVRAPPLDDSQLSFFVPSIHDAPIKDDFNLMDIAPFALSKTTGEGIIRYELKDSIITVEGGAVVGLATAYDYDIVINMISHLADATRQYRIDEAKGLRPSLPPRVYRPAASEILKFCRRELGGKQYEDLERALDRLQATRIKITNLSTKDTGRSKRRETESFPLIGRYKVVSRTSHDRIDQVEIDIPNWVYEGVVKPDGKPSILTLNPDYFLITRPIAKFLYRLARKAAGQTEAHYGLTELHKRSGSKLPRHKFRQAIREIVEAAVPLPDYDLSLIDGETEPVLRMVNRAYDKNSVQRSFPDCQNQPLPK
ncbi:replication initiator protein A [Beijerinckia indica]|uniref:Replication protein n=1 Tax=Beijerinckia indica subsp. indica (strain ATCC 9039 / DSM 1715 / NCIMB 8712) TaxID=395963 RepID=B2ILL8_BEII9|nr:replication initiator protein A [Beijerinckia indica]ACB97418.1 replication protein [Beijerinckia indica subsp. indica ATCC 9039]